MPTIQIAELDHKLLFRYQDAKAREKASRTYEVHAGKDALQIS